MNDVLFLISSKMNNQSLEVLSHIPDIWIQIRKYQADQEWWFLRVEQLAGKRLKRRECNWREAYQVLQQLDLSKPTRVESNILVNNILAEIGKYNYGYRKTSCWRCGGYEFSACIDLLGSMNAHSILRCITCHQIR